MKPLYLKLLLYLKKIIIARDSFVDLLGGVRKLYIMKDLFGVIITHINVISHYDTYHFTMRIYS